MQSRLLNDGRPWRGSSVLVGEMKRVRYHRLEGDAELNFWVGFAVSSGIRADRLCRGI